ncbi:MAG TPA: TIGR02680 family protein, partial [Kineosporiaceae bacterium]
MTLTPSVADQDARHRAGSRTEAGARRPDRGTERWAPTRAGILNVWRYYDEVFAFHRGRLLLRGPNGTGKSKALEVLLPFLFDASLRPNRLSTFGTADRTMHWNLMGEGATGVTRVGYVWLEFGQGDRWFTCGARLQASAHTTGVGADYFTTTRRVGVPQGLHLVNEQGQPLTRAALAEALGDHGTLHAGPGDYRLTLRTALFPGVGEQRFDALVTALLQLRTPKLSQRLDPGLLSALLSRALPALDQADVAELAEGFERLDRRREELRHLDDVVAAAEQVAAHARTYARRVLRAGSAALIAATSTMDRLTREARTSQDSYQEVSAELETATRLRETLLAQQLAVEARITGLTASEAYRRGEHLVQLRSQSGRARRQADELASVADRRVAAASAAGAAADRQRDVAREAGSAVDQARDELARHAERLSLGSTVPVADPHLDAFAARALVQAAVSERSRQIEEVRGAAARHRQAVADRERAESERERVRTRHAEAVQAHEESESAHQAAVAALTGELEAWASGCTQLRLDVEQLLARAGSAAAVARLVSEARHARAATLADEASTLSARMTSTAERRDAVRAQLEECLSAVDLPPAAPATRTADRTGWPGAPLWRVTDFVPGLPARLQAGIEAALEGCGLLDAWISPDGGVLDESGHDVFAVVEPDRLPGAAAAHPGPDRSLAAGAEPACAGPAAAG